MFQFHYFRAEICSIKIICISIPIDNLIITRHSHFIQEFPLTLSEVRHVPHFFLSTHLYDTFNCKLFRQLLILLIHVKAQTYGYTLFSHVKELRIFIYAYIYTNIWECLW